MPGKPVQPAEREEMFRYFLAGHTRAEVAEKFNRDPVTVQSIAHDDHWEDREQAAHAKALELIGSRHAKEMAKTIKGMIFRRDYIQQELVKAIKDGKGDGLLQAERWSQINAIDDRLLKIMGMNEKPMLQVNVQGENVQINAIDIPVADLAREKAEALEAKIRLIERIEDMEKEGEDGS